MPGSGRQLLLRQPPLGVPPARIFVGLVFLFWWLVFQPRLPRAAVTEVELWTFNLTDDANALLFNATVHIAVRNPNRRIGLYYDSLDAALNYHGARLQLVLLRPFYQHHRTSAELSAKFGGQADNARAVAAFYGTEKNHGTYSFDVKVGVSLRMKLWFIKIGHFHPEFDCSVGVRAPPMGGGMSASFGMWMCDR